MSKTKRPPHDYNADLRIEPYADENTTGEELYARFQRAVRATVRGGAPRREITKPKPAK